MRELVDFDDQFGQSRHQRPGNSVLTIWCGPYFLFTRNFSYNAEQHPRLPEDNIPLSPSLFAIFTGQPLDTIISQAFASSRS